MDRRPEGERRRRRRYYPLRAIVVGAWMLAAFGVVVATHGAFWRDVGYWMERAGAHAEAGEWSEALVYVGRALEGAPDDPVILAFGGHAHAQLGDWPQAAEFLERALQFDSTQIDASLGLAEARLQLGNAGAAAAGLSGLDMSSADHPTRLRAAWLAERAGRPDLALDFLESGPDEDLLERARLARAAGDGARALQLLERARQIDPSPEARRAWAAALKEAGRSDEARVEYEALRVQALLDTESSLQYAWLLSEFGDHRATLEVLDDLPPLPEVIDLSVRSALWADDPALARERLTLLPAGDPTLEAEIVALEGRQARAEARAMAEVQASAPPTDPAEALVFWQARLAEDPSDGAARAEVVALLESTGRFGEALDVLLASQSPTPAATTRAARLALWTDRPDLAVRLLEAIPATDTPDRTRSLLLAEALLETGHPEAAYRTLAGAVPVAGHEGAPASAEEHLLRARIADASGRPGEAAMQLAELARTRELELDERRWWAGLLWRSGGLEGALQGYEGLEELLPQDPELLLAIADLQMATGRFIESEHSYRSVLAIEGDSSGARRGLALALLRQGRTAEAIEAYRSHLRASPDDADARLSLARSLAAMGRPEEAATEYERYAAAPAGPLDVDLADEISGAWMAAGDFPRAEDWARRGLAAEGHPLARLRIAHLQQLQGRHEESSSLVDAVAAEVDGRPQDDGLEDALVRAWIHRLRNQPVAALGALDGQAAPADTTRLAREVRVFRAEVAESRGDLAAAADYVHDAEEAGATATELAHVSSQVRAGHGSSVTAGYRSGSDANDLDVRTSWARLAVRPSGLGAPAVALEIGARAADQASLERPANVFAVVVDSLFLGRSWSFGARMDLESQRDIGIRVHGGLSATYETAGAIRLSAALMREAVWTEGRDTGAPEYGRVRELISLDPRLTSEAIRLSATTTPTSAGRRSAHLEGGISRYSDGNRRLHGYAEARQPVFVGDRGSVALVPNLFAEGFETPRTAYASPGRFLMVGLGAAGNRRLGPVWVDARATPHLFSFGEEDGFGFDATVAATLSGGIGSLRVSGRFLDQGDAYDLFRLGTEVTLSLGRGRP